MLQKYGKIKEKTNVTYYSLFQKNIVLLQLKRNTDMNKNIQGHLFALTANILWGLMAPIGKSALAEFSALSVTTFRMVGAAACFWLLSLFCKREQVDHRDMLKIFFATLFALVFNQGVYIFGLSMTSPIDASIVTTTLPIVTMIVAAIYLKEPVTNKKVLGIFVGAMGALILIMNSQNTGSGGGSVIGDLLCLIAQISFSIYLTVFKGLSQKYSPITLNKWMFVYASMCYIPFSYHGIAAIQWAEVSTAALVQVGYVVVGGCFLDGTKITASHSSEHVQLYATHRSFNSYGRNRYGNIQSGKRNCHCTGVSRCIYRNAKQVTQGLRERGERGVRKQSFVYYEL